MTRQKKENLRIDFFDKSNIEELDWASYSEGLKMKDYFELFLKNETRTFISNLQIETALLSLDKQLIPLAISSPSANKQAYVASNMGQYLDYPLEELKRFDIVKGLKKWFGIASLKMIKAICKLSRFDDCVFVNSFYLSSNLWYEYRIDYEEVIQFLIRKYPKKSIVFKGIIPDYHKKSFHELEKARCKPVFSRELYFVNTGEKGYRKKRAFIRDRKHAEKLQGEFVWNENDQLSQEDAADFLDFYKQLYIDKYSSFNPEYSSDFLNMVSKSDFFRIGTIRKDAKLLAAQILFKRSGMLTTPFIGYDRNLPRETGLYRLLNYYLMEDAAKNELTLNMSSGASEFKKQRGGLPSLEFNLVYFDHLNLIRRLPWLIFKNIGEKVVIPNLSKVKL